LNFSSSVSTSLFRTWGTLTFQGGLALPYLILNATLWNGDRLVESTRYMMIEVEPGRRRDFDICESCRLSPGINYTCLLEVEEPKELFVSEWQDCIVAEDDPKVVIWEENGVVSVQEEPPENGSVDSPLPSASAKATSSSSSKLTASSQDLEDYSDDPESEDEGRSSDSSSDDQRETEAEVEIDYEDNQVVEGRYVGSTTSNKYHRPDCSYAKKIKPENRIYFSDVWAARDAGYLPCKACNPD